MKKLTKIKYDEKITNLKDLLIQLYSLKQEAFQMMIEEKKEMGFDVFEKDFHALAILIAWLKENSEVLDK